jgi:solute carrier family 25 phosphate transporter 23/24/25/41
MNEGMENEEEMIEEENTEKISHTPIVITGNEKYQFLSASKNILAGGIAGSFAKTVTAPLARLTVLYQVSPILAAQGGQTKIKVDDSLWKSMRNIVRTEGFFSLWKGNFTAVIHRFPFSAINFASFEALRFYTSNMEDTMLHRIGCGGLAGAIACFICYPLDLVRVRLTVGTITDNAVNAKDKKPKLTSKIMDMFAETLEKDGFRGLYRGLTVTLLVAVPNYALSFGVYGQVKKYMLHEKKGTFVHKKTGHLTATGSLISGCISGMFCSTVLFPIDVIRKRMQVSGGSSSSSKSSPQQPNISKPKGFVAHARSITAADGLRGFYRGLFPELLKVCPMVALTFCSYEISKNFLDQYYPS